MLVDGRTVVGVDNLNSYYDPKLKKARLAGLLAHTKFHFEERDLADRHAVAALFATHRFAHVVHLAAQAGVRYSLLDPHAYVDANLVGFLNILEGCRQVGSEHLIYASSSSVYGGNTRMPLRASDNTDHPLSLYGATKKANESMAHSYSSLFGLPATGLRFFTVYGPWNRPDMAMWLFTAAIMDGKPIKLFNNGRMRRDFTYIDDVTEGVVRLLGYPPSPDPEWSGATPAAATSNAPWRLYNIGNSQPVELLDVVRLLEKTPSAVRQFGNFCRCSRATSLKPVPIVQTWNALSAFDRTLPSRMVCGCSSTGFAPTAKLKHSRGFTSTRSL